MHSTRLKDLRALIESYGIPSNSTVIVHGGLLKLGLIENGVKGVYSTLQEALGPEATIVMPAFTFGYGETRVWSQTTTKAETGALSEYMRKLPGVIRTIHPFHSVCAMGKHARTFEDCSATSSFGAGSPFDLLYRMDAWNLSIGTEFIGGATYLHHTEEETQVPYREYKEFPGQVLVGPDSRPDSRVFRMYVRSITAEYEYDNTWDKVWDDLNAAGLFKEKTLNGAKFLLSRIRPTHDEFARLIRRDPFYAAKIFPKTGSASK